MEIFAIETNDLVNALRVSAEVRGKTVKFDNRTIVEFTTDYKTGLLKVNSMRVERYRISPRWSEMSELERSHVVAAVLALGKTQFVSSDGFDRQKMIITGAPVEVAKPQPDYSIPTLEGRPLSSQRRELTGKQASESVSGAVLAGAVLGGMLGVMASSRRK